MRRVLCMCMVCVCLLAGCAEKTAPPVTDGFRCTVTLDYDGAAYEGAFTRTAQDNGTLTLTAPAAVSGLGMAWTGEEVSLTYGGMELKLDEEALPVGAAIKVMCRVLDICGTRVAAGEATSNIDGDLAGTPFVVTFDPASGYPLTLELSSVPLTVTFSAWEPCGST